MSLPISLPAFPLAPGAEQPLAADLAGTPVAATEFHCVLDETAVGTDVLPAGAPNHSPESEAAPLAAFPSLEQLAAALAFAFVPANLPAPPPVVDRTLDGEAQPGQPSAEAGLANSFAGQAGSAAVPPFMAPRAPVLPGSVQGAGSARAETADSPHSAAPALRPELKALLAKGTSVLEYHVGAGAELELATESSARPMGPITGLKAAYETPAVANGLRSTLGATAGPEVQGESRSLSPADLRLTSLGTARTSGVAGAEVAETGVQAETAAASALNANQVPAAHSAGLQERAASTGLRRKPAAEARGSGPLTEKFAAGLLSGREDGRSGELSPVEPRKNMFLDPKQEQLAYGMPAVGTRGANQGDTTMSSARTSSLDLPGTALAAAGHVAPAGTSALSEPAALQSTPASHAADLVREIHEIADGMWAIERNSVEVRFKFGENERLAVRVDYRDGTVQATFRTDSAELTEVIAREWQAQAMAAEYRPYRLADPVFVSAPPSNGQGAMGDFHGSRQQQHAAGQPFSTHFSLGENRSGTSTTADSAPPHGARPDTAHHLHTFA